MDRLTRAQGELYDVLRRFGPCFLRVSATQDALWVCDLPRRTADAAPAEAALRALDVACVPEAGLWKLDWTQARYQAMEKALPDALPSFPADQAPEEAYALCRFLLLHPAPLAKQPMDMVREVLKLDETHLKERPDIIRRLHERCAALLREGAPLPTLAGRLLRDWLNTMERGKEA